MQEIIESDNNNLAPESMNFFVNEDTTFPPIEPVPLQTSPQLDETAITGMSNSELKQELIKWGVSGVQNKNKTWLTNRLRQFFSLPIETTTTLPTANQNSSTNKKGKRNTTTIPGFPSTAKWVSLTPNNKPVEEPKNEFLLHAPNVSEGDEPFLIAK